MQEVTGHDESAIQFIFYCGKHSFVKLCHRQQTCSRHSGTSAVSTNHDRSNHDYGDLLVYSAFRRNADFNSRDPYRQEHSDYEIDSTDGILLRSVHNNSGSIIKTSYLCRFHLENILSKHAPTVMDS